MKTDSSLAEAGKLATGPAGGSTETPNADDGEVLSGLTQRDVAHRLALGQRNLASITSTRSYLDILRHNALTLINVVLYVTCGLLAAMGLYGDALVTIGLVVFNVVISVFQEARTKRALDRISLLTWPRATVVREGSEHVVDPTDVVQDDILVANPGDQIVVDGPLIAGHGVEVDESLLTGESEPVRKEIGDTVLSGSYCVSGRGLYRAEVIGKESLANTLTAGARAFRLNQTPMQRDIDLIVRVTILAVVFVGGPVLMDLGVRILELAVRWLHEPLSSAIIDAYGGYPIEDTVRSAAVIVALIPQGLALMLAVSYAAAALRLSGSGVLIQQTNAMESLSHVDVLCLDKTGTLTTNQLEVAEILPLGIEVTYLRGLIGDFAANVSSRNKTTQALAAAFPGSAREGSSEVPFSSARKWSSISFDEEPGRGVYVLGAPDVLASRMEGDASFREIVAEWSARGRRVLLLASNPDPHSASAIEREPALPRLTPIGLVALTDGLRADSPETLRHFAEVGVDLKLISGDDPRTVAALARQVGFPTDGQVVSGLDLHSLDEEAFAEVASTATIFGRTTPEQKQRLIRALQDQGKYVAMTGDGVNDVPALKQANLGIAMRSGSDATRGVADLILMEDSFGALPAAFSEGQRIVAGMQDIASLFLARSLSVLLILIGAEFVDVPFPLTPRHNALLAMLTVGVPVLGLAAWARPHAEPRRLLHRIALFALPAAITIAPAGLTTYMLWWRLTDDVALSRSVLTAVAVLGGLVLIPFAQPPNRWFVAGDEFSGDKRPAIMTVALLGCFLVIVATPSLRSIFELAPLGLDDLLVAFIAAGAWTLVLRWAWRERVFTRLVGISSRSSGSRGSAP